MVEIKDEDILAAFKLGEKDPEDKILHGVLRKKGGNFVIYERKTDPGYSGFLDKSLFDLSSLSPVQIEYLTKKGYPLER